MRLDHLLSKEFFLIKSGHRVPLWGGGGSHVFGWTLAGRMVRSQHEVLDGYVGALSGVWEDTVYHLVVPTVVVGVWGWWFVFPWALVACRPRVCGWCGFWWCCVRTG